MSKRYWIWMTVGMMLIAMALSACGKKEETVAEPLVVELPIEEESTSRSTDEEPEEVADEAVADAQEEKTPATKTNPTESSTQQKKQSGTTRLTRIHQHQYEADVDGHWFTCGCDATKAAHEQDTHGICSICGADVKELEAQRDALLAQSMSNNVTTRNASDDTKTDSGNESGNKTESGATSNSTDTSQSEYPLVDADPLAKNTEVLNSALWSERLAGNQEFSLPVKDFYFVSKKVSAKQMKEEIDRLVTEVDCIEEITYVTTQKDGIDLNSDVSIHIKEGALFGSRQAFDDAYEKAKDQKAPQEITLTEEVLWNLYLEEILKNEINALTDEEYADLQLAIYDFLYAQALKCEVSPTENDIKTFLTKEKCFYDTCQTDADEILQFMSENKVFYPIIQYYRDESENQKYRVLNIVTSNIKRYAPDMCFWLSDIKTIDADTIEIKFKMFPVYETYTENGQVVMDKSKYKSVATLAKEVDDKLNQVIADIIDNDMSTLAREYALFHYCDTYFAYDGVNDLGDAYAIYDKPYTVAAPIDSSTGKKNVATAKMSTQGDSGIYTTAMTGWGVCVGHGKFFHALCTKAGIRCDYVDKEGHAWNKVRIGGKGYLVDAGKRAPYPHFNITHEWAETYKVIDEKVSSVIAGDSSYADSGSPIPLYQAGYVEETTQQDGEWIYYINFDDNGSLYKINVDGTGNQKISDSSTTIEDAYAWVTNEDNYGESDVWKTQWSNAEYGSEYSGQGYTNKLAMDYRWALGHNFQLLKENGEIIYKVNNISRVTEIPMLENREEIINLTCNMDDAYYNLGILSGTASINTSKSLGDSIKSVVFYVDGIEYPASWLTESEDGQSVDFTFRLPTDKGMEHHDLEILVTTINGGAKRQEVMTQTLHPTGIKESYLWNGKYYTIEGVIAKEGRAFIIVKRYTQDGQDDGSVSLTISEYQGNETINAPFKTFKKEEGSIGILLNDGNVGTICLEADEKVATIYLDEPEKAPELNISDIVCSDSANEVYIFTAKGFCMYAQMNRDGFYRNATVEVCADLDFSTLSEEETFIPITFFNGTWKGNCFKMKGLSLNLVGDAYIFNEVYGKVQDIYVCDSNIIGTKSASIINKLVDGSIRNLWVENVSIAGSNNVGTVGYISRSNVEDVYLKDIKVDGDESVAACAGYAYDSKINRVQVLGDSEVSGKKWVGGILGDGGSVSSIKNCINDATVTASNKSIGGIAGRLSCDEIAYCMNYGNIITDGVNVGGIIGKAVNVENIYHVENYGDISGMTCVGGIVGECKNISIDTAVSASTVTYDQFTYRANVFGYDEGNTQVRFVTCRMTKEDDIGGYVSKSAKIYNTISIGAGVQLTSNDIANMFKSKEAIVEILTDNVNMPSEAGRQAYYKN